MADVTNGKWWKIDVKLLADFVSILQIGAKLYIISKRSIYSWESVFIIRIAIILMYIFESSYVVPVIGHSKKEDNFSYLHIESNTQILTVFCSFIFEVLSIKVKEII